MSDTRSLENMSFSPSFFRHRGPKRWGLLSSKHPRGIWGQTVTLPTTNSIAPENRPGPKRKLIFQPSTFRVRTVSFREGKIEGGDTSRVKVSNSEPSLFAKDEPASYRGEVRNPTKRYPLLPETNSSSVRTWKTEVGRWVSCLGGKGLVPGVLGSVIKSTISYNIEVGFTSSFKPWHGLIPQDGGHQQALKRWLMGPNQVNLKNLVQYLNVLLARLLVLPSDGVSLNPTKTPYG